MKYIRITGYCFLLLLISCSKSKVPSDILGPEKMQAVYFDFLQADVFANEFVTKDSNKNIDIENAKLQQIIFKKHNVSKETFYKSYDYYLDHQMLMKGMLDTMMVRQQRIIEIKKDTSRGKAVAL